MIWIVLGCCWVSQIRTKPTKNIWGPLLDSISSYYVQCPWKIVSFFQVFWHLNYHILVFFPAYIGLYWTPAGWYGQKPYLGPAHMWLRQNMAVCDAELGPKWGGVTNTRFTFLASYRDARTHLKRVDLVGRFDGRNVSEGPEKKQCPSQICLIIIVI